MAGQVAAIKLRQFIDPAPETIPGTIFHQGKDVIGYFPGQLARLYIAYPPERQLRHFTKLQPAPEKDEIIYPHEFDYLILQQYIHYQSAKMKVLDWYTQTTYKESFTLPCFKSGSADDSYRRRSDAEILSLWKSTSAMKKDRVKPSFMGV
ncbi:protein SPMIP3 [Candoia aspera]|uniref:protein SPMIP3 n=1 Tax=Candoia aspera TaxID=51853 RepID=UPI002FD871F5